MRPIDILTFLEFALDVSSLWDAAHVDESSSPWWRMGLAAALAIVAMAATVSLLA